MIKTGRGKNLETFRPTRDKMGRVNGWENPYFSGAYSSRGFGGAENLLSDKTLGQTQPKVFFFLFAEKFNFATKCPKREILGKISKLWERK